MKIIIDQRESQKRIDNAIEMFESKLVDAEVGVIEVGDYLLVNDEDQVIGAIEYKTYDDFVSSMLNGHLESQLNDMDKYNNPFLFVVGTYGIWRKKNPNMHVKKRAIDGFVVKCASAHKTRLVQLDSEPSALDSMVMLLTQSKKKDPQIIMPERHKTTGNPQLDAFLSLPHIGKARAVKYAEKISFYQFLTVCRDENAVSIFKKVYQLNINKQIIEYCKKL